MNSQAPARSSRSQTCSPRVLRDRAVKSPLRGDFKPALRAAAFWVPAASSAINGHGVAPEVGRWLQDSLSLQEDAVKTFIQRFGDRITGILSGFDRLLFRGYLGQFLSVPGLVSYMNWRRVLRAHYADFSRDLTEQLIETSLAEAKRLGRPIEYLRSPHIRKEEVAHEIARRDSITEGLVCVLTAVEPCSSFRVGWNPKTHNGEMRKGYRQCKHLYHYFIDPVFGFMHVRLQTWLPFTLQVCINGREWLSRQMDAAGIGYERRGNCFVRIDDREAAQKLLDDQVTIDWRRELRRLSRVANPELSTLLRSCRPDYFWSLSQSEWASDVMFADPEALGELYPRLTRYAIDALSSEDVMRFLGRKLRGNYRGEIVGDFARRVEGIRVKHSVDRNSIKVYDKQGLLRVETTINNAREFKVLRRAQGDRTSPLRLRPLRQGIPDLRARAQISQRANGRYMDAIAAVETDRVLRQIVEQLDRPARWKKHRVRPLHAGSQTDLKLFEAVCRGEFLINGFRNRDLQAVLFDKPPASPAERRRRSASVTRLIRLLRAHRLIRKLPRTHRYKLTTQGTELLLPLLAAQNLSVAKIQRAA